MKKKKIFQKGKHHVTPYFFEKQQLFSFHRHFGSLHFLQWLFCFIYFLVSPFQTWVVYMDGKEVEFNLIYQLLVSNAYTAIHNINFTAFETWNNQHIDQRVPITLCIYELAYWYEYSF